MSPWSGVTSGSATPFLHTGFLPGSPTLNPTPTWQPSTFGSTSVTPLSSNRLPFVHVNGPTGDHTKSCWVLFYGSMGRHLVLVARLNAHDLEPRNGTAKQAAERTWWQSVWLVSQGQTATEIARST